MLAHMREINTAEIHWDDPRDGSLRREEKDSEAHMANLHRAIRKLKRAALYQGDSCRNPQVSAGQ